MSYDDDDEDCDVDYEDDEDAEDGVRPEWPEGNGRLVVYEHYQPLFTSALWQVIAKLNGKVLHTSRESPKPHGDAFVKRWTRQLIRMRKSWLEAVGVDVVAEYTKWGGDEGDLD